MKFINPEINILIIPLSDELGIIWINAHAYYFEEILA